MPAFDTSALVPLFDDGHPHHDEARRRFETADLVVLHPCVITELTTVIRRTAKDAGRDGNQAARHALRALLAQPRVSVRADLDHDRVVTRYLDTPALSITDAVVVESVHAFDKKPPVTFDDRLTKPSRAKRKTTRP